VPVVLISFIYSLRKNVKQFFFDTM